MYQVPMQVWNAIAASQPLSPKWAELFRQPQQDLPKALEPIYAELDALKVDNRVQRAFVLVAPLLVENESISAYLEEMNLQHLRAAMPELSSISEAVALASAEFPMTPAQQQKLASLLAKEVAEALRPPAQAATSRPAARAN